jgi:hypothetical protein
MKSGLPEMIKVAKMLAKHLVGLLNFTLFPNEASLLSLTSALLCEINKECLTGKSYLNMNPADLPQI